jgi:hypothetical protein
MPLQRIPVSIGFYWFPRETKRGLLRECINITRSHHHIHVIVQVIDHNLIMQTLDTMNSLPQITSYTNTSPQERDMTTKEMKRPSSASVCSDRATKRRRVSFAEYAIKIAPHPDHSVDESLWIQYEELVRSARQIKAEVASHLMGDANVSDYADALVEAYTRCCLNDKQNTNAEIIAYLRTGADQFRGLELHMVPLLAQERKRLRHIHSKGLSNLYAGLKVHRPDMADEIVAAVSRDQSEVSRKFARFFGSADATASFLSEFGTIMDRSKSLDTSDSKEVNETMGPHQLVASPMA